MNTKKITKKTMLFSSRVKNIRTLFMYLKIKIHQTQFNCALQNFKINVDIAVEKTYSHVGHIHWVI
jgi:hypothetical protein